jgi:(hydroxyamino)benzene mutase
MSRRLMWHGMSLFLLGLLTGFAEPHFANIRMGLAAFGVRFTAPI